MVNFINKQYSVSEEISNNLINQGSSQVQRSEILDIAQQLLAEVTLSNSTPPPLCSRLDLIMWELTRRIPKPEREKINRVINDLPNKDTYIPQLLEVLNDHNWAHPILQNKNYSYYALAAVKEGKLNSFQFGTLMLYWTATEYHVTASEIESIPLFLPCESSPDGLKINPVAFEYIKQTMKGGSENFPDYIHLTDDQIVEMLEKMKEAPLSEQQILVTPQFIKTTTVGTRIKENGVNIFRDFNIQNPDGTTTNKRMIAPITLKQAFLNVKFKEQAVNIQVVLSNSSLRDISLNAITNSRDMGIPYPGTTLNPKADHFPAPGIEYPDHDFFHALMASLVPLHLRFATSRAALVASNSLPFEKNANAFKNHLLDLEFTLFREESRKADEREGHTFIKEVIMRIKPPEGFFSPKDVRIQQLFDVLIDIMHHEEEWKAEFGITKEDIDINKIKAYIFKTIKDISSIDHQQIIKLFYLLEEGRKAENFYLEGNENAGNPIVLSFLIFIRQQPLLNTYNKSCQIDILDYQHIFFAAFKNSQILKTALEGVHKFKF